MRKFFKVTNCRTGSSELVLADGHVDALSFYRKKNNVERSVILSCADHYTCNDDGDRFMITKLSELPDDATFHRVLPSGCSNVPFRKDSRMANGMVQCYRTDINAAASYFKGSTIVTVEVQDV
jgi:hypothetical protein